MRDNRGTHRVCAGSGDSAPTLARATQQEPPIYPRDPKFQESVEIFHNLMIALRESQASGLTGFRSCGDFAFGFARSLMFFDRSFVTAGNQAGRMSGEIGGLYHEAGEARTCPSGATEAKSHRR